MAHLWQGLPGGEYGRPTNHTDELMDLFRAVQVSDIYENATFDERIAQLRQTQRQKRRETPAMAA